MHVQLGQRDMPQIFGRGERLALSLDRTSATCRSEANAIYSIADSPEPGQIAEQSQESSSKSAIPPRPSFNTHESLDSRTRRSPSPVGRSERDRSRRNSPRGRSRDGRSTTTPPPPRQSSYRARGGGRQGEWQSDEDWDDDERACESRPRRRTETRDRVENTSSSKGKGKETPFHDALNVFTKCVTSIPYVAPPE